MKRKIQRTVSLFLSLLLLIAIIPSGNAAEARASNYFALTEVWATATGSGKFIVEFDINATHTMTEVGATEIIIKERQSDGSYNNVKTFTSDNTSGLITNNSSAAYGKVSYSGKPGTKYYAIVTLYAKDSKGSESMDQGSNTITV